LKTIPSTGVTPLSRIALIGQAALQGVVHVDALDDQYPVFDLDLAFSGRD